MTGPTIKFNQRLQVSDYNQETIKRLLRNPDFLDFMSELDRRALEKVAEFRDTCETSNEMAVIRGWLQCADEMRTMFHVKHLETSLENNRGMY